MSFLCSALKYLVVSSLTLKQISINEETKLSKLVCLLEDEEGPIGAFEESLTRIRKQSLTDKTQERIAALNRVSLTT